MATDQQTCTRSLDEVVDWLHSTLQWMTESEISRVMTDKQVRDLERFAEKASAILEGEE